MDDSKGTREDGTFCFLKQFGFCNDGDCSCEKPSTPDKWEQCAVSMARAFELENE